VGVKIIVDFTACVHFRHVIEMGGVYFSFNVLVAQASPFIALYFYENSASYDPTSNLSQKFSPLLKILSGIWLFWVLVFFKTIKSDKIKSFFTLMTAAHWTVDLFHESTDDASKAESIIDNHSSLWVSIKGEVVEWFWRSYRVWKSQR